MIKILIGGSPCTYWSIAQTNHREVTASGIGWELFKNYLIAKEKFQPDYFLYENNKSAAQAIKDQISTELGVDLMYINSALVSAQNRQRFYAFNWEVAQPEDRGILLRDILETTTHEKGYKLDLSHASEPSDLLYPLNETEGKSYALKAQYAKSSIANYITGEHYPASGVAIPVRIGTIENNLKNKKHNSKQYRVYSVDGKSTTLCGQGGGVGAKTGLYAIPIDANTNTPPSMRVKEATKQGYVDILPGDCVDLAMENSKTRRGRSMKNKANCLTTCNFMYEYCGTIDAPIYEVSNGHVIVNDKKYPIQLKDGYYIIRKLTVNECCRLQTMPDNYCRAVSNSQAYKGLGNGWTAEVIIHILNGILKDVPKDEEIVVLSMYDGIGTGRYCLDKMGFTNIKYYAYEIDKYAMKIAQSNYPDIIELGDAFQLRDDDWKLPL